jgi:hypothetical protein
LLIDKDKVSKGGLVAVWLAFGAVALDLFAVSKLKLIMI